MSIAAFRGMRPENEPLRGLAEGDALAVGAAVREGVHECRLALAGWLDSSDSRPIEEAVSQVASRILRPVAASDARPPGPAAVLLVRLLVVALLEEMGRPHIVTLN
jgi:hypothetical protein